MAKRDQETIAALLGQAPPPPPPEPAQTEPERANPVAVEAEPERPAPRRRAEPKPPLIPTPAGKHITLQTRIPAALLERVKTSKDDMGETHETWFLDAFDAVYDDLADHYEPRPERRSRVPARQRRTRRPTGEVLASYPLRLTEDEIAVLRDREAELAPPSLADFVTTIVRLRLEQLGA